ncbi:MAG: penicillin acylase family protein [Gemmatimonadaceae bacterium]|nr:penicillin acylase family protein [Gemmatimonadaceae bacterium]
MPHRSFRLTGVAIALMLTATHERALHAQAARQTTDTLAQHVEIRRTTWGVPHIKADNLAAAAYALAYVQLEDYGARVALGLLRGRGEMGRWFGRDSMASDFAARPAYTIAVAKYATLDAQTRAVYEGFAAGVNRYIARHPDEFPAGFAPQFTGYDVAARDVQVANAASATRLLARLEPTRARPARGDVDPPALPDDALDALQAHTAGVDPIEEGSNAWAFAPSRTRSGRAVLVRNPHLAWDAGYYEAHVHVPGVLEFYGDFRIGGPFTVIGGFNRYLGWATTNNAPDNDEFYALDVDPERADHFLFDDTSVPLERVLVTVPYRNGPGISTETRETWRTPLGPVVHRDGGKIYVLRTAGDGDHRAGQQFLRMMQATTLDEWKAAMRMRARTTSSFTYADRAGNVFYVWNGLNPILPHPSGGDTAATPARRTADVFTQLIPWDSLPQLLNPKGGYVRNENDAPYHTNLHAVLDRARYPANMPEPSLRLRSQLSLALIDDGRKRSLEEIMALKNSYRMLLADRVKGELLAALEAASLTDAQRSATELLRRWDNTAAPDSRGAVLFSLWWQRYTEGRNADSMFARPWDVTDPVRTPSGVRDAARAVEAFRWAVDETVRRHGAADVAWGTVHRVRVGGFDEPVGGCSGALGCFRVLNFRNEPDGKRAVTGGDGWVIGVEFTDAPRAFSVLAYGQSNKPGHPHNGDQGQLFARGEYKRVAFTEADIEAQVIRRYRPGLEP